VDNLDYYSLIFFDPELRRGLASNAQRVHLAPHSRRPVRARVARALHALANHVEPNAVSVDTASGPCCLRTPCYRAT
jgi:hypothetical protein